MLNCTDVKCGAPRSATSSHTHIHGDPGVAGLTVPFFVMESVMDEKCLVHDTSHHNRGNCQPRECLEPCDDECCSRPGTVVTVSKGDGSCLQGAG